MSNLSKFIAQGVIKGESNSFVKVILNIAAASIAISLVVMILSLNIISGFEHEISKKIFDFWGHISVKDINSRKSIENVPISLDTVILSQINSLDKITYDEYDPVSDTWNEVTASGGIKRVSPFISAPGILQSPEGMEGIVLKGLSPKDSVHGLNDYLIEGSWLSVNAERRQIILSESTSQRIKRSVGDKVIIHFIDNGKQVPKVFYVSGIYRTGLEEFEKLISITDLATIQSILDWNENQVGGLEVVVESMEDLNLYTSYINYEILPSQVYARSTRDEFLSIFQWLELQEVNKVLILGLLIAISIINMITAILILILERTQLVGVLKTLGAQNWTIRKVFLRYGAYILLRALFFGNAIGIGLSYIQYSTQVLKMDEKNYYISYVPIDFQWIQILYLNIAIFFIIMIFLIIPSALVSRIKPVKVLRFE